MASRTYELPIPQSAPVVLDGAPSDPEVIDLGVGVDNAPKGNSPECLWDLNQVKKVTAKLDLKWYRAFITQTRDLINAKGPTQHATFCLCFADGVWRVPSKCGVANPLIKHLGTTSYWGFQSLIFEELFEISLPKMEAFLVELYGHADECVEDGALSLPSAQWMQQRFAALGLALAPDEDQMELMREVIFGVLLYPVYIQLTGYYPAMSSKRAPDFPLVLVGSPWGMKAAFDKVNTRPDGVKPSALLPGVFKEIIENAGDLFTTPKRPVKPLSAAKDESAHERAVRLYTNVDLGLHGTEDNRSERIAAAATFCKDKTDAQIMEAHNLLKPPSPKKVRSGEDKARTAARTLMTYMKRLDDPVAFDRVYAEFRADAKAFRKAERQRLAEATEASAKRQRPDEAEAAEASAKRQRPDEEDDSAVQEEAN